MVQKVTVLEKALGRNLSSEKAYTEGDYNNH